MYIYSVGKTQISERWLHSSLTINKTLKCTNGMHVQCIIGNLLVLGQGLTLVMRSLKCQCRRGQGSSGWDTDAACEIPARTDVCI